jgi:tetratricopeptide (TPR) repeat protein
MPSELGSSIGRFGPIGAAAGALLGGFLFGSSGPKIEGPRLGDLDVSSSTYGGVIPVGFGVQKVAGAMIWATNIDEDKNTRKEGGGLFGGGQKIVEYRYFANFAVAFGEGPAGGVLRIWAGDNALAWLALFEADFFRGDLDRAFSAGEQAIALNPSHPELKALVGMRLAHSGQWERGIGLVEEALTMNPAPPPWYYFPLSMDAFRQGHDDAALRWAERIDLPGFFWTQALLAAIYSQLDRREDAARAAARLLELYPDFEDRALIELGRQHFKPAVLNRFINGLRKAGLEIAAPAENSDRLG